MSNWYWLTAWLPSLLAIIGNGLVIYLIRSRPRLRTLQNRFVLSLAIADFCVGTCYYPGHVICNFLLDSKCNVMIRDDIAVRHGYRQVHRHCQTFTLLNTHDDYTRKNTDDNSMDDSDGSLLYSRHLCQPEIV